MHPRSCASPPFEPPFPPPFPILSRINRVALPPPPPPLIPRRGRSFSATAVRGIISSASRLQIYSSWGRSAIGVGLGWVIDGNGTGWSIPYILREDESGGTNCGSEMRIWPNLDRRGGRVRRWCSSLSSRERKRDRQTCLFFSSIYNVYNWRENRKWMMGWNFFISFDLLTLPKKEKERYILNCNYTDIYRSKIILG